MTGTTPTFEAPPRTVASDDWRFAIRASLAVCQATSVLATWSLWQARPGDDPLPHLPLFDSTWFDAVPISFGWPVLVTLAFVLWRPIWGVVVHGVVLAIAIALDQRRLQPEFLSIAILLAASLPGKSAGALARGHLAGLWLWAGIHKLASPGFWETIDATLAAWSQGTVSEEAGLLLGAVGAVAECVIGVCVLFVRTRRVAAIVAVVMHASILAMLIAARWNVAVWPWNIALGIAAIGLLANDREPLFVGTPATEHRASLALAWTFVLYPALYYVNACDASLAWCVYAMNVPQPSWIPAPPETADQTPSIAGGASMHPPHFERFGTPFPTSLSRCRAHLRRVGRPGDRVAIVDPRPLSAWMSRDVIVLELQADGTIVER